MHADRIFWVMNKKFRFILIAAICVFAALTALIIVLITDNSHSEKEVDRVRNEADSLRLANDRLELTNEFNRINADFNQFEDQQKYLKNDSLVIQYNEARQKVESLLKELSKEKKSNASNRQRIKELEAEITTLKGIVRHYLAEIQRLGEENEGLKQEIAAVNQRNEQLNSQVTETTSRNEQLTQTVQLAKKLNITGLSLAAYNKKGKAEKKVNKATQLGVSFTVSPNNTAAPGEKDFIVRIISPEGSLLGGGISFHFDGATVAATAHRKLEYANDELRVSIYWDVNTTLTPGDYTVEVFCDGYRLGSRHVTLGN